MEAQELVKLFQQTGLFDIKPDEYIEPGDPVGEKETVVGEMNDLEKSCYTLVEKLQKEHDELHKKMYSSGISRKSEEYAKAEDRHLYLHTVKDTILETMWLSIKSRGLQFPKGCIGFSVCKGFKVVAMFKKHEQEDDFPSPGLPGMTTGVMIISIGHSG